ncbi:MAG: DNA alkylation repair protein [Burkholderiales bacterium]|nr:DNA alkylation repair protein [Burkholderiales bacterium]
MPEAFKHLIHAGTVTDAARHLGRACASFDSGRFVQRATDGLEGLEMKARAMRIADALDEELPPGLAPAAEAIESALAPLHADGSADAAHGLSGWVLWAAGDLLTRRALAEPAALPRALQALHALTQRFTAEFAIRPLLRDHPAEVWPVLYRWAEDPSAAVRRLASEGSRPRLPWGLRLQASVDDPRPPWPILQRLQDDPDESVRRSVANHLNDIAKDHPDTVADWIARWLPGAPAARRGVLRHASRTLVKQGHASVLQAWGLGRAFDGSATLQVAPAQARVGDELQLAVTLRSTATEPQALVIDYAVAHAGARAARAPKVFKGWTLTLAPGEARALTRRHSLRPITTRRYHPGAHPVSLRINGQVVAEGGFELVADVGAPGA